jgi:hypothetical protein
VNYPQLVWMLVATVFVCCIFFLALWRVSLRRLVEMRASVSEYQAFAARHASRADLHERRAGEFFGIIEGVEKERDTWQRLYRDSSQMAGVAQAWLLRDLSSSVRAANVYAERLRAKGEKVMNVQVDPRLSDLVEEFGGQHVSPPTGSESGAGEKVARAPGMEAALLVAPVRVPAEPPEAA